MKESNITPFLNGRKLVIQKTKDEKTHTAKETHRIMESETCLVRSTITRYNTLTSFKETWLDPNLIETEYNYIRDGGLEEEAIEMDLPSLLYSSHETQVELLGELEDAQFLLALLTLRETLDSLPQLKGLSIELIESSQSGTGLGTGLIKQYKQRMDYIVLYSTLEAETYWEKQGFTEWINGFYFWTTNEKLNEIFRSL